MSLLDVLESLIPVVGEEAIRRAGAALEDLGAESEGIKALLLSASADAIRVFGPKGLDVAVEALERLENGDPFEGLDWASPRTVSEVLALVQQREAGNRTDWTAIKAHVSTILSVLLTGVLQALRD